MRTSRDLDPVTVDGGVFDQLYKPKYEAAIRMIDNTPGIALGIRIAECPLVTLDVQEHIF
jgi:hypothetical protein